MIGYAPRCTQCGGPLRRVSRFCQTIALTCRTCAGFSTQLVPAPVAVTL
jgi:hypothetical protein